MPHEPMPVETAASSFVQARAINMFNRIYNEQWARGAAKYGTELKTFNGRDAGNDAMQELADAVAYVMQLILENNWLREEVKYLNGISMESNREENSSLA
jgi:hypothetical protein